MYSPSLAAELIDEKPKTQTTLQGQENVVPTASANLSANSERQPSNKESEISQNLDSKFSHKRPVEDMEPGEPEMNPFEEIEHDRSLQRQVILHMALQRNIGDEAAPTPDPMDVQSLNPKTVIEDGFYWREFPVCEQVLYKHMTDYYGVSKAQRLSKLQQSFNKKLVREVQEAAREAGLTFGPNFTEKKLRDRIRCFYKTHLQNAKKRLATLQKHPESEDNRALLRVYIRCVRTGVSFEDSLNKEPVDHIPRKRGRLTQVEKAIQALETKQQAITEATTVPGA